jgi:hypothetical protein
LGTLDTLLPTHITPYPPAGDPIANCKTLPARPADGRPELHRAAFDRHILGIPRDLIVEVWLDILREFDGPKPKHRLQVFQEGPIVVLQA